MKGVTSWSVPGGQPPAPWLDSRVAGVGRSVVHLSSSLLHPPLIQPDAAPDPEQLPLGVHEGAPLIAPDEFGAHDETIVVPLREPPVCGEWSYDDSELEEPRFAARRIDGIAVPTSKATPIHPIRVTVDPKVAAARAAARERESAASLSATVSSAARPRTSEPGSGPSRALFTNRCALSCALLKPFR